MASRITLPSAPGMAASGIIMQQPSIDQLRRALRIAGQIEKLEAQMGAILGGGLGNLALAATGKPRRKMSAAARAKIAAAQRARWAKAKGGKTKGGRKRGKLSAAGRAAIVAAQKARWAKIKANK